MSNISSDLKERAERCCCRRCGSPLKPQLIVYDRYGGHGIELYCEKCKKIEYGTEREIFELAEKFISGFEFNYFQDMEENNYCEKLNIAKICDILAWAFEEIGLLDGNGIKQNLWNKMNSTFSEITEIQEER